MLLYVFSNGVPDREFVDSDFTSNFLNTNDWFFNICDINKIKLHLGLFWAPDETAKIMNETYSTAYVSTNTKTVAYMARFTKWLTAKYSNHSSFYCISLGNEWAFDVTHGDPSPKQLGDVFCYVANEIHSVSKNVIVTSNINSPARSGSPDRDTMDIVIKQYNEIFSGLDMWTLHIYSNFGYSGYNTNVAGGVLNPTSANNFGFEFLDAYIDSLINAAALQGKQLAIGETAIPKSLEPYNTTIKKKRLLSSCIKAKYVLLWQLLPTPSMSPNYGSPDFVIDASSDTVWKTLITNIGKVKLNTTNIVFPSYARKNPEPIECVRCTSATNAFGSVTITSGSTAKLSATDISNMFWIRLDAPLGSLQSFFRLDPTSQNGIIWLGSSETSAKSVYCAYKTSGTSIGSASFAGFPPMNVGTWYHFAIVPRNSSPFVVDFFVNGLYWTSFAINSRTLGIGPGTLYLGTVGGGGSDIGASVSFQDFSIIQNASYADVIKHMNGEFNPRSLLHVSSNNKIVSDISNNPVTLSVGVSAFAEYVR